jgi:phosphoenolpyruvate carboxykinase (ATP)
MSRTFSIQTTRSCVDAILDGSIADAETIEDPIFGFQVPTSLKGIDSHLLNPKATWSSGDAYDKMAKTLANMYVKNFEKYQGVGSIDYTKFGPKV